jgi:hypothetical protein
VIAATPRTSSNTGVYGFRLQGVPEASGLLVEAPEDWPNVQIERTHDGSRPASELVTADEASVWLAGGGFAELDRSRLTARMAVPEGTTDAALVHPFLAPVALVMAWWLGRLSFHGGGVIADGGVWGVLGDKMAGKSTLLAALALAGMEVLTDDVLVINGEAALAGPRSIDLRADAARRLGIGEPLGRIGARERWRVALEPVEAELPLRGWITLGWGDGPAVQPVRGRDRLSALLPHQGVRLSAPDPAALVRASALPHWRLVRSRDWEALDQLRDRVLDAIAG